MNASHFDRVVRMLAAAGTRRGLLARLAALPVAGPLAARLAEPSEATRTRRRRLRHKTEDRRGAELEACIPTGKKCPSKKPRGRKGKKLGCNHCCQAFVVTDARGRRRCACTPNGASCAGKGAAACCSGVCANAVCQPGCRQNGDCGPNRLCIDGQCRNCTVTCPGGTCPGMALQAALSQVGTVYVCPGRYIGAFTLNPPQALTVIGAGQGDNPGTDTILDAAQSGSVLTIVNGLPVAVTLERLHITGGASGTGAGVFHEGTTLRMTDCTVTGNTIADGFGAGILNGNFATMELIRCTVRDNHATGAQWYAGGIYTDGTLTVTDCLIADNSADNGSGGGMFLFGGQTTLRGTTEVRGNQALSGGGIYVSLGTLTIEAGCRVTANTATGGPDTGGGILNDAGTVQLATDQIVTGNLPDNCEGVVPNCVG